MGLRKKFATYILLATSLTAMAVPAKPGLTSFTQPDGSEIKVTIHGDEYHHFYTSEDGYLLVEDGNQFYYADMDTDGKVVRSDIKATAPSLRTAEAGEYLKGVNMPRILNEMSRHAAAKESMMARTTGYSMHQFADSRRKGPGLFQDNNVPAAGVQKALVILVEYKDVHMNTSGKYTVDAKDYFTRMLNEPGFSDLGATGSAVDFFREVSDGQFQPQFDVYGVVRLPNTQAYYGGNDGYGNDKNPAQMVVEACEILDDEIDFSQYDRNGDGYVDNVFIFYAGKGEASGGGANTVWPHAWQVEYGNDGVMPEHDGVKISKYGCTNEWVGDRPDGVGTFVHEFSHLLGLPDLYSTSYVQGTFTPGSWSCMDYGPYNNNGMTPPLYGAFERYALGWMEPVPLDHPVNVSLPSIGSNRAAIVKASENEFFLFENRQQVSWDRFIPGHGMLAWHIDYNSNIWNRNVVNNDADHQYVDIEEADGTQTENSRRGDTFPGTAGKTSFTDDTTPSMRTWANEPLGTPITDISENDGIITFKVMGGTGEEESVSSITEAMDAENVDDEGFTAEWKEIENASYSLSVFTRDGNGGDKFLAKDRFMGTATSCHITGLEAETDYCYYVKISTGWVNGEESNTVNVRTAPLSLSKRMAVALEATDIDDTSFVAHWEKLPVPADYIVNLKQATVLGPLTDLQDFTDGISRVLSGGWTSTSYSSYASTGYSGENIPALRLKAPEDNITSPVYDAPVHGFTFWHRATGTEPDASLKVMVTDSKNNTSLFKELPVVTAKGGQINEFNLEEAGFNDIRQISIVFNRYNNKGSVAIDDINVFYGTKYGYLPVEAYTEYNAGDSDFLKIEGLAPGTLYVYKVRATDGTLHSQESGAIQATTTGNANDSGVSYIIATGRTEVYDISGRHIATLEDGNGGLSLQPGIYVLKTGSKTIKVRI